MSEDQKNKPLLEYPCSWIYKIIGTNEDDMKNAVGEILCDRPCQISFSRSSEKSKYLALNVELTVESESQRQAFYEALKAHRAITLVL